MREIILTRGFVALVDDEDYDVVMAAGPWHASGTGRTRYARHSYTQTRQILMHVLLTGWPETDHINLNGLDNRRSNLRAATRFQNLGNRPVRSDSRSGLKGVRRHTSGRWIARCCRDYLGIYDSAAEAAMAYDAAALAQFGEFARLNFPKELLDA
jgi:hypothetical protein